MDIGLVYISFEWYFYPELLFDIDIIIYDYLFKQ